MGLFSIKNKGGERASRKKLAAVIELKDSEDGLAIAGVLPHTTNNSSRYKINKTRRVKRLRIKRFLLPSASAAKNRFRRLCEDYSRTSPVAGGYVPPSGFEGKNSLTPASTKAASTIDVKKIPTPKVKSQQVRRSKKFEKLDEKDADSFDEWYHSENESSDKTFDVRTEVDSKDSFSSINVKKLPRKLSGDGHNDDCSPIITDTAPAVPTSRQAASDDGTEFRQFVFDKRFSRIETVAIERSEHGSASDFSNFVVAAAKLTQSFSTDRTVQSKSSAKSVGSSDRSQRSHQHPDTALPSVLRATSYEQVNHSLATTSEVSHHGSVNQSFSPKLLKRDTALPSALKGGLQQRIKPNLAAASEVSHHDSVNQSCSSKLLKPSPASQNSLKSIIPLKKDSSTIASQRSRHSSSLSSEKEVEWGSSESAQSIDLQDPFSARKPVSRHNHVPPNVITTSSNMSVISMVSGTNATVTSAGASVEFDRPSPSATSRSRDHRHNQPFISDAGAKWFETSLNPFKERTNQTNDGRDDALIVSIVKAASRGTTFNTSEATNPRPDPPSRTAQAFSENEGGNLYNASSKDIRQTASEGDAHLHQRRPMMSPKQLLQSSSENDMDRFVGPQKRPPKGIPSNAILASMLFRQTYSASSDSNKEQTDQVDQNNEPRDSSNDLGIPPSIVTDDTAESTISSVTEEASAFYEKNFQWNKQAQHIVNNLYSKRKLRPAYYRCDQPSLLDRVEEENSNMFYA